MRSKLWVLVVVLAVVAQAHADVALLLEEPFGLFGRMNPTGHAAVYLTGVCADSPTRLRRCESGEAGVVISRYRKIAGYDWLAIPLVPYLYAVGSPEQIPASENPKSVAALRDDYRRAHLLMIAASDSENRAPEGEWIELVGSAYDRKIYGFRIATTAAQDDAFIQRFNHRSNKGKFNLLFRNCADFARSVLNFYYPHAVHRNFLADAGIMTPKQAAKSLVSYCRHHPELACSSFVIPQVPGSIPRSEPAKGVLEALLKTKKYVLPLVVLHPFVAGSLVLVYVAEGRFNPKRNAAVIDVAELVQAHPAESITATVPSGKVETNDRTTSPLASMQPASLNNRLRQ